MVAYVVDPARVGIGATCTCRSVACPAGSVIKYKWHGIRPFVKIIEVIGDLKVNGFVFGVFVDVQWNCA
jgi:hypothetical protein